LERSKRFFWRGRTAYLRGFREVEPPTSSDCGSTSLKRPLQKDLSKYKTSPKKAVRSLQSLKKERIERAKQKKLAKFLKAT